MPTFQQFITLWVGGIMKIIFSNLLQCREKDEITCEIQLPSLLLKTSQGRKCTVSVDKALLPFISPNISAKSRKLQLLPTAYSRRQGFLTLFSMGPFYSPGGSFPLAFLWSRASIESNPWKGCWGGGASLPELHPELAAEMAAQLLHEHSSRRPAGHCFTALTARRFLLVSSLDLLH